jgi:polysaccharide export outer membrane protein
MQPASLGAAVSRFVTTALFASLALASSSRAQNIETPQQTNDRIRTLAAASHRSTARDYVIGAGDVVTVQVFDVPELSRELRVSQTGTIGIPLVPVRLRIAGLTEAQAERKVQEVLEANGLVSHPEVTISVKEKKSKPITVVGAVAHPMVYQADRQVTLIEVLAEVGGVASDAGDSVIVTRQETDVAAELSDPPSISSDDARVPSSGSSGAPVPQSRAGNSPAASVIAGDTPPPLSNSITVNLNQILEGADMKNNIALFPGDVVTVPHAGIVYVLGAVQRPGGFVVSNDRAQLTTLKVLSLAGGLNRTAKSDHAVIVRKDSAGQQHEVEVDLKKVMRFQSEDLQLRPSDILYVPTSSTKQALIKAGELSLAVGTGVLVYRLVP